MRCARWHRPMVWQRGEMPDGQPTAEIVSPSYIGFHDADFAPPESLHSRTREWRCADAARRLPRPFPSQPGPLNTPAGLKPMIDLMQRARDRETYGGACD